MPNLTRPDGSLLHYDHRLATVGGQDYAKVIAWAEGMVNNSRIIQPEFVDVARTLLQLHDLLPNLKQDIATAMLSVRSYALDDAMRVLTQTVNALLPFFEEV